jgi:hypothetical protein
MPTLFASRLRSMLVLVLPYISLTLAASQDKKPAEKKDAPKLLYAMPLAAKTGEKQKLTLRGKGLAAVKDVKVTGVENVTAKVLSAKGVGVPNNYPAERVGDSEVEIELQLPNESKPGEVKLTAVSPGGESNAYTLLLRDDVPAVAEQEPNDGFAQAQKIAVPSAVEGTIKNERDVDVFQFEGKKGDKVRIELQAARYGSPLDGMLTLYDADRGTVDSASDSKAAQDPILNVTLPRDGAYFIVVMDANDLGGANYGYRLVVTKTK